MAEYSVSVVVEGGQYGDVKQVSKTVLLDGFKFQSDAGLYAQKITKLAEVVTEIIDENF
jgi:hypothetical protein